MSTTLHLINVVFKYSEYHKSIILVTKSRTLIIVDPEGERATSLLDYAKNASLILNDTIEPDLTTIKIVMTLQQISDQIAKSTDDVFYCLTYSMITHMDIDGWTRFYSRKW